MLVLAGDMEGDMPKDLATDSLQEGRTEPDEVSVSNNAQHDEPRVKNGNNEATAECERPKRKHNARGEELTDDPGGIVPNAGSESAEGKEMPGILVRRYTSKNLNPDEEPEDYKERDQNEFPIQISQAYYLADSIESLDTSIRDSSSKLKFTPPGQILQHSPIESIPGEKVPLIEEKMGFKKITKTRISHMDKVEKVKAKHRDDYHNIRHYEEDIDKDDVQMNEDPEQRARDQSETIAELQRNLLPLVPEEHAVPPCGLSEEDIEYPDYYYYFQSKSDVKFDCTSVAELIQEVLNDELNGKVYSAEESETWTKNIATTLRNRIKGLGFKRYKYVVQVVLGENIGAGIRIASRCMWDADSDNHASDTYTNVSKILIVW